MDIISDAGTPALMTLYSRMQAAYRPNVGNCLSTCMFVCMLHICFTAVYCFFP